MLQRGGRLRPEGSPGQGPAPRAGTAVRSPGAQLSGQNRMGPRPLGSGMSVGLTGWKPMAEFPVLRRNRARGPDCSHNSARGGQEAGPGRSRGGAEAGHGGVGPDQCPQE